MDIHTLRETILASDSREWTTYETQEEPDRLCGRAVFNGDLMITIEFKWNDGVFFAGNSNHIPSWAKVGMPHTSTYAGSANICYNNNRIMHETLISVDDWRGVIPYPKASNHDDVNPEFYTDQLHLRVSEIASKIWGGLNDDYFSRSGIIVR